MGNTSTFSSLMLMIAIEVFSSKVLKVATKRFYMILLLKKIERKGGGFPL